MADKFITRTMFFWIIGGLCFIAITITTGGLTVYSRGQDARDQAICEKIAGRYNEAELKYVKIQKHNQLNMEVQLIKQDIKYIRDTVDEILRTIKPYPYRAESD